MYEIVVRINGVEVVYDTIKGLEAASLHTSWYRQQGIAAFYRPVLSRVA